MWTENHRVEKHPLHRIKYGVKSFQIPKLITEVTNYSNISQVGQVVYGDPVLCGKLRVPRIKGYLKLYYQETVF